jgi:hypothetical protein
MVSVPAIATPQPQYSTIQDIYSDGILAKIYVAILSSTVPTRFIALLFGISHVQNKPNI